MSMLSNDSDGSFARIPPLLAAMALQKIGLPSQCAKAHTITQKYINHYIKTATGVSTGMIKYDKKEYKIYDTENNLVLLKDRHNNYIWPYQPEPSTSMNFFRVKP